MSFFLFIISIVVIVAAVSLTIGLVYYLRHRHYLKNCPDYERVLTKLEKGKIIQESQRVVAYRNRIEIPKRYGYFTMAGLVPVMLGMSVLSAANWAILRITRKLREENSTTEYVFINIGGFGVSSVLAVFTGILVASWATILIGRFSRGYKEYLTYPIGWGKMQNTPRTDQEIQNDIEHAIRIRELEPGYKYSINQLTDVIFERANPLYIASAKMLLFLMTVFLIADISYLEKYSKRDMVQRRYFSPQVNTYSYTEISALRPVCRRFSDDGKARAAFDYYIDFEGGPEMRYFGNSASEKDIQIVKDMVDAALVKPHELKTVSSNKNITANQGQCLAYLRKRYSPQTFSELKPLFNN